MSIDDLLNRMKSLFRTPTALRNQSHEISSATGSPCLGQVLMSLCLNQRLKNSSDLEAKIRNWTLDFSRLVENETDRSATTRDIIVILCYTLVVIVSIIGNGLVCRVAFQKKGMQSTTNMFIANLSVSDLLLTVLNIPFNLARILLDNWIFGSFMCSFLPFVQVESVYVSTFTMTCIALDRYQVILNPFKLRSKSLPAGLKIFFIWILATSLAIPHAIYNEVIEIFTYRNLVRCQAQYPEPAVEYRKWITLMTFFTQFVFPLSITAAAYILIVYRVWAREILGAVTEDQVVNQTRSKKKTIKMLVLVVIIFALCWLPLNIYNVIVDVNLSSSLKRNSTVFLICHWLAMSSVCYNPFIYCWLNDSFRSAARSWYTCCCKVGSYRCLSGNHCRFNCRRFAIEHRCEHTLRTTSSSLRSQGSLKSSFYRQASQLYSNDTVGTELVATKSIAMNKALIPIKILRILTHPSRGSHQATSGLNVSNGTVQVKDSQRRFSEAKTFMHDSELNNLECSDGTQV